MYHRRSTQRRRAGIVKTITTSWHTLFRLFCFTNSVTFATNILYTPKLQRNLSLHLDQILRVTIFRVPFPDNDHPITPESTYPFNVVLAPRNHLFNRNFRMLTVRPKLLNALNEFCAVRLIGALSGDTGVCVLCKVKGHLENFQKIIFLVVGF